MTGSGLLRSPLHDQHVSSGAVMGERGGWEVPLRYGEAAAEAQAARGRAGAFDVTPWGRIRLRGAGAADLLGALAGPEAAGQEDDTVRSVEIAVEPAGKAQVRLVRLADFWLVLTEPEDRPGVLTLLQQGALARSAKVDDQTEQSAMIAIVGPDAPRLLDAASPIKVSDVRDGAARTGSVLIAKYIALRHDMVGDSSACNSGRAAGPGKAVGRAWESAVARELHALRLWRIEVILPTMLAGRAWGFLTQKGRDGRIVPCGLEAMEILRKGKP